MTSISETLNYQFQMDGAKLKASVMFPGPNLVNTNILNSARNKPEEYDGEDSVTPAFVSMQQLAESSGRALKLTEPEEVAAYTLEGIRNDQFWIFPPGDNQKDKLRARTNSILERRNPLLAEA